MSEQAITTVEELPAELRAELVAKREAGTTLAELKKGYPQVAPDVIRTVLPPMPKGTEAQPAARKPRATKPAQAKPKPQPPSPRSRRPTARSRNQTRRSSGWPRRS
jgi:hypothetical protein